MPHDKTDSRPKALEDTDFIRDATEKYRKAREHSGKWKKRTKRNYDFYAGRQWDDQEANDLGVQGKAAVVMNRIKPRVSAVVGMEISNRQESAIALLAGKPRQIFLHNTERSYMIDRAYDLVKTDKTLEFHRDHHDSTNLHSIQDTDLLFIDSKHTFNRLLEELTKFAPNCKRYIVMHDTQLYGEHGEDGGAGLLAALVVFIKNNPEWSVIRHVNNQYGLTTLSCNPDDKPKLPSKWEMAKNLAVAVKDYVADGMQNVTAEQLEERLKICTLCDQLTEKRCAACGCPVDKKGTMRNQTCPLAKWPLELE